VAKSRVYFISDVHGSNRCFRKFLNAAGFYKADILILGGDITGKVMTPIIEGGDGSFRCTYQGSDLVLKNNEEVEEFRKKAADFGSYTSLVSPSEFEELKANPGRLQSSSTELWWKGRGSGFPWRRRGSGRRL